MNNTSNPLADISHDDDACADCGAAIHGDDNASAFGDNLNVCDDCESKREATAERQGCAHCGSTLGLDCGDAEPDFDAMHCSEGCYKAAHSEVSSQNAELLAALEMAQRLASYGRRDGEIYDVAKAAIAKAKGCYKAAHSEVS